LVRALKSDRGTASLFGRSRRRDLFCFYIRIGLIELAEAVADL
jgi:hypothetical protein